MRLATLIHQARLRGGIVIRHPRTESDWIFLPDGVANAALRLQTLKGAGYTWWRPDFLPPGLDEWPDGVAEWLSLGPEAMAALRRLEDFLRIYLEQGDPLMLAGTGWPLEQVQLEAPLPEPPLLLGVVGNNAGFLRMDTARARNLHQPSCHQRTLTSLVGPGHPMVLPPGGEAYAGTTEMGIVIGRTGRDIPRERAREYIAGYTVINDALGSLYANRWTALARQSGVSSTDFHSANSASWLDKKADTMLAMGPWIVTPDEVGDPYDLLCWYREDGVTRNRAHTGAMVCGIEELIHWLSGFLTLQPGMVLHLGSLGQDGIPAASGVEQICVESEIERIGILRNPVVRAKPSADNAPPVVRRLQEAARPPLTAEAWNVADTCHFWTLVRNSKIESSPAEAKPYPLVYNNPATALAASGSVIELPARARCVTATCEFGVVIGSAMRAVRPRDVAAGLLGGITIIVLRDSSFADGLIQPHPLPAHMPEMYARWPDGFNIVGRPQPLKDFRNAPMTISLNGSDPVTIDNGGYLLPIEQAIAELSLGVTLLPGDVICFGATAACLTLPPAGQIPAGAVLRASIAGFAEVSATLEDKRLPV